MFDFDATLPLMAVQFLLLTALLNAVFYKPLTKVLDERDEYIRGGATDSREMLAKAESIVAEYEKQIAEARRESQNLIQTEHGQQLSLDPKLTQTILASLNERIEEATHMGEKMVVLCSPVIRRHFKRLTEKFIPNLIVVSHNELSPEVNIRSLGTVRV